MRKLAMSLTAASLLFSGLAGCGDVNDTGMNDQRSGYTVNQGGAARDGQADDGTMFGRNNNRGFDQGGMFRNNNNRGGVFGQNEGRGFNQGSNGFNQGREYIGNNPNNRGLGNESETRGAGQTGTQRGYNYQQDQAGTHGLNHGNRGRTSAYEARENGQHRGFGRGITGDNRPGMVDEDGLLNGQRANVTGQNRGTTHNRGIQHRGTGDQINDGATGFFNRQNTNNRTNNMNNRNQNNNTNNAYYNGQDGQLASRINTNLANAGIGDDYHVVVNGNSVIIAVNDDGDTKTIEKNVNNTVSNVRDDLDVHVVTDRDRVNQVRGMNDRLRAGEPFEEIGATFNDMLNDLGDAAQRPFERSR
ncbi:MULTISPECIES: YhcN/YlaJ family sporulation lipoprotein [Bacillaceae]|uniref:YhcN/YlaJ family sporulation lipoprotein n=1 Tax=Evansella alkalicola TaxID=745819 RepID=A0ABS6JQ66_9BACI|nr:MULTISPECIES: YhcN/YlaJ family sporulation lipoprotein [Bacillaceae]MBU9720703.1 YhcN/YlaJ family sporulation lipoprotein [Bacillus alkalicola]